MKPRLMLEQHREMGLSLARMRDQLVTECVLLGNAYPQSGPEAAPLRALEWAIKKIDAARTELENALYREHPSEAETTVYYPHREHREGGWPTDGAR